MRLFLVRHGETDTNRQGLALGRADVPLNERGRWQAQRLAQALARESLAAVYASPLQRAQDTAGAIAQARGLEVQTNDDLIEMDIGEAEGLSFAEIRARYPDLIEGWATGAELQPFPGGERLIDVQARAWRAVEALQQRHPQDTVLAVSHNFVILCLLCRILGLELNQFRRLRHSIAAISTVDILPEQMAIVRLNDTCHLEDEG